MKTQFEKATDIRRTKRALENLYNIAIQIDEILTALLSPLTPITTFPPAHQQRGMIDTHRSIRDTVGTINTAIGKMYNGQQVRLPLRLIDRLYDAVRFLSPYQRITKDLGRFLDVHCPKYTISDILSAPMPSRHVAL